MTSASKGLEPFLSPQDQLHTPSRGCEAELLHARGPRDEVFSAVHGAQGLVHVIGRMSVVPAFTKVRRLHPHGEALLSRYTAS